MTRTDPKKFVMALTALILMGATPALAEDGHHKGDGPRKDKGARMFENADANKDGKLTKGEMRDAHEKRIDKMFDELDSDKSGDLSKAELDAGRDKMREKMKERLKDKKESGSGKYDDGPQPPPPGE